MTLNFGLMKVKLLIFVSVQKEMPVTRDPDLAPVPVLEVVILLIKVVALLVMPPPSDSTELPHQGHFL